MKIVLPDVSPGEPFTARAPMTRGMPTALLVGLLMVGCAATTPERPASRTVRYTCDGGQIISATYLDHGSRGPTFVVLDWNGQTYGLAPAVSASGARYAGLYGPTVADRGLEWWEAKGEATLSVFTGKDFADTRALLTRCRPHR